MAILIADDESNTRQALREILNELGYPVILEAKNGEEALKIALAEKARLEWIIADWEMPYLDGIELLRKVAEIPELDRTPFLLITSDLPKSKLEELQESVPRLDAWLIKPFRIQALNHALLDAEQNCGLRRHTLLCVSREIPPTLAKAIAASKKTIPWSSPVLISDAATLTRELASKSNELLRRVGAVLMDPSIPLPEEWLTRFKKSPMGNSIPWVCLGRDPEKTFSLRTHCEIFVPMPLTLEGAESLLDQLHLELCSGWHASFYSQQAREALQRGDMRQAKLLVNKALGLHKNRAETQTLCGEIEEAGGKLESAFVHYVRSIEINPCQPRAHIKSIELAAKLHHPTVVQLLNQAISFCPQSPNVLLKAAKAAKDAGEHEQAKRYLRKILELQPMHSEARSMLSSLP